MTAPLPSCPFLSGILSPSRHARPRSGILSPSRHARPRSGILSPSRHARPRSGIQDKESLFWRGVKGRKSGICLSWILAFARMTAGEALQVVVFFTGGDAPLSSCPTPIGHPGQRILGVKGRKTVFMFPGSKAFARMTAPLPYVMPFPVGHPGQRVLILAGR